MKKTVFIILISYLLVGVILTSFVLLSPNGHVYYSNPIEIILGIVAWPLWLTSFIGCGDFGCLSIGNELVR
ncbi:MAG: hypothetical protein Q8P07_03725 [bacterium]|nr:hypothetical protein [bacterium]